MNWDGYLNHFCKLRFSRNSTCEVVGFWAKLAVFPMKPCFLLERITDRQTGFSDWILHRYFLKNDWSEPVASRKITDSICCQSLNLSFQWELKFWKTCIYYCELDSFQILKYFSDEIGDDINKCEVLIPIMRCSNIWKICIT